MTYFIVKAKGTNDIQFVQPINQALEEKIIERTTFDYENQDIGIVNPCTKQEREHIRLIIHHALCIARDLVSEGDASPTDFQKLKEEL